MAQVPEDDSSRRTPGTGSNSTTQSDLGIGTAAAAASTASASGSTSDSGRSNSATSAIPLRLLTPAPSSSTESAAFSSLTSTFFVSGSPPLASPPLARAQSLRSATSGSSAGAPSSSSSRRPHLASRASSSETVSRLSPLSTVAASSSSSSSSSPLYRAGSTPTSSTSSSPPPSSSSSSSSSPPSITSRRLSVATYAGSSVGSTRRSRQGTVSAIVSSSASLTDYTTSLESGSESESGHHIGPHVTGMFSPTHDKASTSSAHLAPPSSVSSSFGGNSGSSSSSSLLTTATTKRSPLATSTVVTTNLLTPSPLGLSESSHPSSPSQAISIPSATQSVPAVIAPSATTTPSSVRLSTTPLFPSPLAQASGPEEDGEPSKGDEDGDEEAIDDEEEEIGHRGGRGALGGGRAGSPLVRENLAPFGDIDISPTLSIVALPDINAPSLQGNLSSTLSAPRVRSTTAPNATTHHKRSPSLVDSSSEHDLARNNWTPRVRSIGRASGLPVSSAVSSPSQSPTTPTDDLGPRRRSRLFDVTSSPAGGNASSSNSTPRASTSAAAAAFAVTSSPPSPSMSSVPANSISRRASINLVSAPRPFAPGSPTSSRAPNRSQLSAQLSSPYPAAPPPAESIKLTKVPESVRSAIDFRPNLLTQSPVGSASDGFTFPTLENALPRTPSATRAHSPASASGSASPAHSENRSRLSSNPSSRPGSRPISRRTSLDRGHHSGPSPATPLTASSAFAPLFPFPSLPPSASTSSAGRSRTKSAAQPFSHALSSSPFDMTGSSSLDEPQHDLGVSPLSAALSPFAANAARDALLSPELLTSISQRQIDNDWAAPSSSLRVTNYRMSIVPTNIGSGSGLFAPESSTDEYAQIIVASRAAKMRKWKSSSGSHPGLARGSSWLSDLSLQPRSQATDEEGLASDAEIVERDITRFEGESEGGNGAQVEWVDWLDEYERMKAAKMRAEQQTPALGAASEAETGGELVDDKGKGKAREQYYPFEATTAAMTPSSPTHSLGPPTTPGLKLQSMPSELSSSSIPMKPIASPLPEPIAPLIRTASTLSTNVGASPGGKRRRSKLGFKIDTWWSAVRSSFSPLSPTDQRAPRTPSDQATSPHTLEPVASRTSSQFTRPQTPKPALRTASSAQDLSARAQAASNMYQSRFGATVPAGALAPGVRFVASNRLQPPKPAQHDSSGSDPSSEGGDPGSETKRKNPRLSLNLGPAFSTLNRDVRVRTYSQGTKPKSASTDSSNSASAGTSHRFFSPISPIGPPSAESSKSGNYSSTVHTQSGSVSFSPMYWDQTPALVPTSTQFPIRGLLAPTDPLPTAVEDKRPKPPAATSQTPNFSMHSVRHTIRSRLSAAKENCDKELRRIIQGITAHVETELHRSDEAPSTAMIGGTAYEDGRFGDLVVNEDAMFAGGLPYDIDSENEAAIDLNDGDDIANTDSDGATSRPSSRTSRMRTPMLSTGAPQPRRPSMTQAAKSPRRASLAPRKRYLTAAPRSADLSAVSLSLAEGATKSGSGSAHSSRSNSRSRSPLPLQLRNASNGSRSPATSTTPNAAHFRVAQPAFIVLLQEIITVATEILDTPVSKLTSNPHSCSDFISRVQQIGKAWDDNPELACRGWYVQLLLAVAGLSRVIEWWEAERGFWSFSEGDDADAEPILFVTKPTAEESPEVRARGDSCSSSAGAVLAAANTMPEGIIGCAPRWSPLGIDLGEQSANPDDSEPTQQQFDDVDADATSEDAAEAHHEDLRQTVEQIRSSTLLMELTLDDQLFQYLSSAWQELVGLEPAECLNFGIADFVFPEDAAVFAEATRQLEADDSHTVEVNFRLRVGSSSQSSDDEESPEDLYEAMEGKGMLMLDGMTGSPSHTMWVVRPAPLADQTDDPVGETLARFGLDTKHRRSASDPVAYQVPNPRLAIETVLCRICERATPIWFFEKHNETCNETHRLEGDITDCNDRLKELARTIDDVAAAIDEASLENVAEYRGIPLLQSSANDTPPSYLEGLKSPLGAAASARPGPFQVRKAQHKTLDQIYDILQTALSISTPSVLDETGDIPIQDQRLLSPNSESNLAAVMRWQRPVADEAALVRLVQDAEEQIRFKLNTVNRLRNTILYAEKVRQEWEARAHEALAAAKEEARSSPFGSPALQPFPSNDAVEALDIPEKDRVRRHSSLYGLTSPLLSPQDSLGGIGSPLGSSVLSPRIPSGVPSSRTKASSIKDFKILKPISKGAFGSVYLAQKITTGDYYAIKTLKKSDMVAKNQVTNVKAERMILMTQTESDFVVKLYYTFQSKDYLYLVMEYLNGGDCGALVKNLGELPEDWAKRYIAEVIVGLEYLHASGIVHRDLKPDNLLIDSKGHLKLTDFGLSRIGLLGRQTQMPTARGRGFEPGRDSLRSLSRDPALSQSSSPSSTPANALGQSPASYFGSVAITDSFSLDTPASERSSGSGDQASNKAPAQTAANPYVDPLTTSRQEALVEPPQKFVGTPDYLAPESILGVGTDACVDWWALGVICYEFLYGVPPFHDETPEKVFENILSHRIEWHEDLVEYSPEARDFMERLLSTDPSCRLGRGGAAEVKAHPWLEGIDWANLLQGEVKFVPNVTDPENTDYFDPRGATEQAFTDEDTQPDEVKTVAATSSTSTFKDPMLPGAQPTVATNLSDIKNSVSSSGARSIGSNSTSTSRRLARERSETEPSPHDDFGTFNFRNLTVLKQANDDVIKKMRDEQLLPPTLSPLESPIMHNRPLALAGGKTSRSRTTSVDFRGPSSPSSPSASSSSSVPSRQTAPSSPYSLQSSHSRRASEVPPTGAPPTAIDRLKTRQASIPTVGPGGTSGHSRRNSLPSRLRRTSISDSGRCLPSEHSLPNERRRTSAQTASSSKSLLEDTQESASPPSLEEEVPDTSANATTNANAYSMLSPPAPTRAIQESTSAPVPTAPIAAAPIPATPVPSSSSRANTIDCLVAGRNPIVTKVLETMLIRLGCRCVVVYNGGDAILAAQGVKFDLIFLDIQMPVVDGETAARMIKSTNNPSQNTPTIAVCSHAGAVDNQAGTLFSGVLPKPILKADLLRIFSRLGFRLEEKPTRRGLSNSVFGNEYRRGSVNDPSSSRRESVTAGSVAGMSDRRRSSGNLLNPPSDERRGSG
ncbi:BQ5605_C002g01515 [Microbotryum silenes-dioicae]|uniref:non-specific serine/threonine protein kinase n=1 Tax=Microbotryum silenes-dioicae TaxID=796604 RepID=A0A2X0MKX7_9BASI|nr:BQ5605_C002g01515 [Microbotryum silenes-dioicae]